jgi:hypothetical protein
MSMPYVCGAATDVPLPALQPWDVLGYPTFSGAAVYRRPVTFPKAGRYALDLGRVEDIAEVSVSGRRLQTIAWPPYFCELGRCPTGTVELEIEVTNGPANRYRASHLPAGLLGPVRLLRTRG